MSISSGEHGTVLTGAGLAPHLDLGSSPQAQGITVAYERARGVRALNQRGHGAYEVSVSKVVAATTADVINAFTKESRRTSASKGFVLRSDGQGRFRYKWDGTTVQFYLLPKDGDKLSVVVTNTKLAGPAILEQHRTQWRSALTALAEYLAR